MRERTEYRFEKTQWSIELHSISPLCNALIIHRNAQSRWVSHLGRGLAVHPWLIPDMADSTKVQKVHNTPYLESNLAMNQT